MDAPFVCGLPACPEGGEFCVLHSRDLGKDLAAFGEALAARLAHAEADPAREWVDLSGVVFPAEAAFRKQEFRKSVSFDAAAFCGDADFFQARFGGYASFRHARFSGDAYFRGAAFASYADFSSAAFADYASVREASFARPAYFDGAAFAGDASFRAAKFTEDFYAIAAAFSGAADFRFAGFGGKAYFDGAAFSGETNFDAASFSGAAYFESGAFAGPVSFAAAAFAHDADFRFCAFSSDASFSDLKLERGAWFAGAAFPGPDSAAMVRFTNLLPDSARRLRLEGTGLERVSLLWSDASQIQFVACRWPRLRGRAAIYDELALNDPEDAAKGSFSQVGALYRQLRLNLEASRQFTEAEDFRVGQWEMRRRDRANSSVLYRSLLNCYRTLSLYGGSYIRPMLFYLLGGAVFALLYLAAGFRGIGDDAALAGRFAQAYGRALAAGGLFNSPADLHSPWDSLVRYINTAWAVAQASLLALALRRRFRS